MKKPKEKRLSEKTLKSWALNLLKFTAPILAGFFTQLSMGVPLRPALVLVALALYGSLADLFKKYADQK